MPNFKPWKQGYMLFFFKLLSFSNHKKQAFNPPEFWSIKLNQGKQTQFLKLAKRQTETLNAVYLPRWVQRDLSLHLLNLWALLDETLNTHTQQTAGPTSASNNCLQNANKTKRLYEFPPSEWEHWNDEAFRLSVFCCFRCEGGTHERHLRLRAQLCQRDELAVPCAVIKIKA